MSVNVPNYGDQTIGVGSPVMVKPTQPIVMQPVSMIAGVQIQQLKVANTPPQSFQTPITTQRQIAGTNVFKYAVQFLTAPAVQNYTSTSVQLNTSLGTSSIQATSGAGPIVFVAPKTSGPSTISIKTNTSTGPNSSTSFGSGNSNRLVQN